MKIRCALPLILVASCCALQEPSVQQGTPAQTQLTSMLPSEWSGETRDELDKVSKDGKMQSAHVILIVEENRSFSTVYPSGMPWLSALGDANGIATNYYSDEPGSLLDYFWLSSGSGEHAFGCGGWGCPGIVTSDNIFR